MNSYTELTATFANVGTGWSVLTVNGPAKYKIHRARAIIESGSASTVALKVAQKDEVKEIKLEYGLTAYIDSIEKDDSVFIFTKEKSKTINNYGTTYLYARVDAGSDSQIYVALDVEVIN